MSPAAPPARLQWRPYRRPLARPLRTAHGLWTDREGLLLRAETPDGRVALGEANPLPWSPENPAEAAAWLAAQPEGAWPVPPPELPALAFALDDLRSGLAEPAGVFPQVESAALLPPLAEAPAALAAAGAAGFRTFKAKVAVGEPARERALVAALLPALPAGGRLRLDANGGWDVPEARCWLAFLADFGPAVEFVEQPLPPEPPGDAATAALAREFAVPLALDESVNAAADAARVLDGGFAGLLALKPAIFGTAAELARTVARAGPARCVFASALEGPVARRRALRQAATFGAPGRAVGFGTPAWWTPAGNLPQSPWLDPLAPSDADLAAWWSQIGRG